MKRTSVVWRVLLGTGIVATLAVGAVALVNDVQAKQCKCPTNNTPVLCDNGRYLNQCVADCNGGKNCVPIPILPPE